MVERIQVGMITWGDKPPYHKYEGAKLTYRQCQKFARLRDTVSLSAALDYALRVGK